MSDKIAGSPCLDEAEGEFPRRLEIPFYIRPVLGSVTGLFSFFLSDMIVKTLSLNKSQSWLSIEGRISYIAVAILAGYASYEFMQRLKEVAKTVFSVDAEGKDNELTS